MMTDPGKPPLAEPIRQGRAMVRLIEALEVLLPDVEPLQAEQLQELQRFYRQRLRQLLSDLPPRSSAQILAASEEISGPVGDVCLN
jgi:hypothetical protein